jgi:two-component system response regulator MprA
VQPHPKRVLVVDDEPTIRDLVAEALREAGFETETAANGVEALTRMQRWLPDAIVLDLMMPRLDGTGFTELMRLNQRFVDVPVLLVTAAYGAAQAAEQTGVQAWLAKPFELDALVDAVTNLAGVPAALPRLERAGGSISRGSPPPAEA